MEKFKKKTAKVLKNGKIIISEEVKVKIGSSVEFPNTLPPIPNKIVEDELSKIKQQIEKMLQINLLDYNKSIKLCLIRKPLFGSNSDLDIAIQKYDFYNNIKSFIRSKKHELNIAREKIIIQLIEKSVNEDFTVTLLVRCLLYLEEVYKKNCKEITSTYKMYANEVSLYNQKIKDLRSLENIKKLLENGPF